MTDAEWNAGRDPAPMLAFLRGKVSERKLRLFAVACCRRVWHLMTDERCRNVVQVAELYADGQVSADALRLARFESHRAKMKLPPISAWACGAATRAAGESYDFAGAARSAAWAMGDAKSELPAEIETQRALMHCIFDNVVSQRVASPSLPAWGDTISMLTKAIYDERAFDRLPILADALEEAGCTDAAILAHCRGPGPHVRGCWVVDLITGRA